MTESIFYAAFFFPTAALVLIFSMKYISEIFKARAHTSNEEAYRELAANVAAAQTESAKALSSYEDSLSEIQARLASIEKILKDVE